VYEHIFAAFPLNESVAFCGVEPLYRPLFLHAQSTLVCVILAICRIGNGGNTRRLL
jgi:hypothetical protein